MHGNKKKQLRAKNCHSKQGDLLTLLNRYTYISLFMGMYDVYVTVTPLLCYTILNFLDQTLHSAFINFAGVSETGKCL